DNDYETSKKLANQQKTITSQAAQIEMLKGQTSQLQQTTSPMPQQLEDLSSRTGAVEQRAAQALGDASAAKQAGDSIDKRLSGKIDVVDAKAIRASQDASRLADQTSSLATRADALEKELDRRAHQLEAQTLELGNRTNSLKEGQDELGREQQAALDAILAQLTSDTNELDRQTQSLWYRFFNKGDARRRVEMLQSRMHELSLGLTTTKSRSAQRYIDQLTSLTAKVEEIGKRVK
ncbi:MAG TPA: hypothetical protein VEZ90_17715, partial [Blastocatellia bacterium]|nr:hypothetical protein [Blastocatellia bacterium]